ncbi:MAG: hypothetical protein ACIAXF_00905 [Phycisphaerales bacterium JB063]
MKKLLSQAWTIIMVTAIAMLVWLYAEDANVKTYNNERVVIKFVPTGEGEMLIEPKAADILVTLTGSNGQFQQFRKAIGDQRVVEIPVALSPGETSETRSIDLRHELESSQALEDLGLNLTSLTQETIDVTVQSIRPHPFPVHINTEGLKLAREVECPVEEVTFRLPASMLTPELLRSPAVINLADQDLSDIEPGTDTRLTLPITPPFDTADLPEGFETRPSATNATVTFRLVVESETFTIDRLIVKLTAPAIVGDRYVIRIAEEDLVLSNIQVQGPPAQIARLKEAGGTSNILATVDLTNAEADEAAAGSGVLTKPVLVLINLPGVRLVSEPPRIPVQVRLREAVEATP